MKNKNSFITKYLLSLSERSGKQKNGDFKIGFDWIIYQYGFFKHWLPIRQPFSIESKDGIISHKTEQEFGIDLSFYDKKNKEFIVFVLKAERLTYSNWTSKNFDSDLRLAISPNFELTGIAVDEIKNYKIIVVYNKSDDIGGIELFDNFFKSSPKAIYSNQIKVSFERWNIDKFSSEVTDNILIPDVLPNNLSGLLSYVTYLFNNINFGTTAWKNQLLPNFKNFLDFVFEKGVDERKIYLIPFALIIIKGNKNTPNSKVAWIELIEWAMLKLWEITLNSNKKIKNIVNDIWNNFYIKELEFYFEVNKNVLCSKNGILVTSPCSELILINTINSTYWHIGRLSLLSLSLLRSNNKENNTILRYYTDYLISILNNNSSVFYPLIDLHHIQIFMIFCILYLGNRLNDFYNFLLNLIHYLIPRRRLNFNIPFIDSSNDLSLLASYITKQIKIRSSFNESSYLITMLLELCLVFEKRKATEIIDFLFKNIIDEKKEQGIKQINLVSWLPDKDWGKNMFSKQIKGTGIDTGNFVDKDKTKYDIIKNFIEVSSKRDINISKLKTPITVYLLSCIKNNSPIPSAFWRMFIIKKQKRNKKQNNV